MQKKLRKILTEFELIPTKDKSEKNNFLYYSKGKFWRDIASNYLLASVVAPHLLHSQRRRRPGRPANLPNMPISKPIDK
jgi:hypothetical protein